MVKTESKPKVVIGNKSKPKVKESKSETFIRIAKPRVKSVLKALRILRNCSNRNNYEYTSEQIESIALALGNALNETIAKFIPSKQEQESFEF